MLTHFIAYLFHLIWLLLLLYCIIKAWWLQHLPSLCVCLCDNSIYQLLDINGWQKYFLILIYFSLNMPSKRDVGKSAEANLIPPPISIQPRCTLYTVHCILYTGHCTLYTVYCILDTVHCILYTVHCTLYTVH